MCAPKRSGEQRIVNVYPLASITDLQGETVVPVVGDEKGVRMVVSARLKRAGHLPVPAGIVEESAHVLKRSRRSLELASHIQRSLPPLCTSLNERAFYSVWWNPKDVVSGDMCEVILSEEGMAQSMAVCHRSPPWHRLHQLRRGGDETLREFRVHRHDGRSQLTHVRGERRHRTD